MNDFESFSASEGQEGVDAGALERLREKMKAASAQMKKDQKQEQKQKQQEDDLYQIILAFLNELGADSPIVILVSKAVAHNIVAEMILAVLSLNYKTIQKILGLELAEKNTTSETTDTKSLVNPKLSSQDLPLYIRINIDAWLKLINTTAFLKPHKNLTSIKDNWEPTEACSAFKNLMSFIAQDYLEREKIEFNAHNINQFMMAFSHNLIERLENHIGETKQINSDEEDDN